MSDAPKATSDAPADLSIVTKTLKLRKPVRKVEDVSLDSLAPPAPLASLAPPPEVPDGKSFQVPSAELLLDPNLKDSKRETKRQDQPSEVNSTAGDKHEDVSEKTPEKAEQPAAPAPAVGDKMESQPSSHSTGRPVPYSEPKWSGCPSTAHSLEVIKNGQLLKTIDLSQRALTVFGRSDQCHVEIEHPSASRYHAVLQCRPSSTHGDASDVESMDTEDGDGRDEFYVYDLGSSNSTAVNKEKLTPKTYYRVRLGHQLRFGYSSRIYVLVSGQPDTTAALIEADAAEEEREVLEHRLRKAREFGRDADAGAAGKPDSKKSGSGKIVKHRDDPNAITWGFQEDDIEEEAVMEERPDFDVLITARQGKAQYFEKDPKKALEAFFDREGLDMEFESDESGSGNKHAYIGRVRLPIQTATGAPVYGEGTASKKKDAQVAAALDACRLLDAQGMLREHQHEKGAGRKSRPKDDDFYDSDEDSFLDRTGTAEKKRQKRMDKAAAAKKGKSGDGVLTHELLTKKLADICSELHEAESKLDKAVAAEKVSEESLDDFMSSLNDRLDRGQRAKLRQTIADLKKDEAQVAKLVTLTAPTKLPELKPQGGQSAGPAELADSPGSEPASSPQAKKKAYSFVGVAKRGAGAGPGALRTPAAKPTAAAAPEPRRRRVANQEEEVDDEEDQPMDEVEERPGAEESVEVMPASCGQAQPRSPATTEPADTPATSSPPPPQVSSLSHGNAAGMDDKEEDDANAPSKAARRRMRRHRQQTSDQSLAATASTVKAAVHEDSLDDWKRDPNVDAWLPPKDQSGDGKTHLNAKFGY